MMLMCCCCCCCLITFVKVSSAVFVAATSTIANGENDNANTTTTIDRNHYSGIDTINTTAIITTSTTTTATSTTTAISTSNNTTIDNFTILPLTSTAKSSSLSSSGFGASQLSSTTIASFLAFPHPYSSLPSSTLPSFDDDMNINKAINEKNHNQYRHISSSDWRTSTLNGTATAERDPLREAYKQIIAQLLSTTTTSSAASSNDSTRLSFKNYYEQDSVSRLITMRPVNESTMFDINTTTTTSTSTSTSNDHENNRPSSISLFVSYYSNLLLENGSSLINTANVSKNGNDCLDQGCLANIANTGITAAAVVAAADQSSNGDENFYDASWSIHLLWYTIFGVMITIGLVANVLVVSAIGGHKSLHTVTNCFLLNLTISDLVTLLFNAIFNLVFMLNGHWPFGGVYCVVNNFITNLTIAVSVFTIMFTSKERYNAIVHPLRERMTKQRAFVHIFVIWLGGTIFALPTLIFSRIVHIRFPGGPMKGQIQRSICLLKWPDGYPGQSRFDFIYNLLFLVLTYLVPLMTMAIAYTLMARVLWGSRQIGESTQAQMNLVCSKQKVVRMLICVVVVFCFCWLPYHIYFLVTYKWPNLVNDKATQHIYLSIYWLAMSNSMLNPIILLLMNHRFRRYAIKYLNCWPFTQLFACVCLSTAPNITTATMTTGIETPAKRGPPPHIGRIKSEIAAASKCSDDNAEFRDTAAIVKANGSNYRETQTILLNGCGGGGKMAPDMTPEIVDRRNASVRIRSLLPNEDYNHHNEDDDEDDGKYFSARRLSASLSSSLNGHHHQLQHQNHHHHHNSPSSNHHHHHHYNYSHNQLHNHYHHRDCRIGSDNNLERNAQR